MNVMLRICICVAEVVSKQAKVSTSRGTDKMNVMNECEELVNELTKKDESWPFLRPVSKKEVSARRMLMT